jgi:uncharacterized protein (DUF697 family)/tellurite resistance protein
MTDAESNAIMTIALLATFADGSNDERERAALKQVANALGNQGGVDLPALHRRVLIEKPDVQTVSAELRTLQARQLAYEMAVAICDADGAEVPQERAFLAELAAALQLPAADARAFADRADEIADAATSDAAAPALAAPVEGGIQGSASLPAEALDKLILNASITNAALELLPETLSSMAIIPLQMRLVYRIGRSYGFPMDRSHARDFIATLGVGLTSQYIEQFGRKLLGGLLGSVAGGLGRGLGRQAASSGLTFATTYAIGRVAQRYYASGRTLDQQSLKATFAALLEEARGLAPRYAREIEQRAGSIDTRNLASLVREV